MKPVILLADDSPTIQRLVDRTFAGSDFAVDAVSNGEAAIRKLETLAPAVILADIYMPGKNGYEVCASVRRHPTLAATPVVLLVGAFEMFDEAEARRVGADAWITKPFEPKQLTQTVAELAVRSGLPEAAGPEPGQAPDVPADSGRPQHEFPRPVQEEPAVVRSEAGNAVSPQVDDAVSVVGSQEPDGPAGGTSADEDILGLNELFPPPAPRESRRALTEEEVEAIADRVIDRLSSEVVESIAWDIVPEIADRVMRDELKKKQ